ncbi:hypothetical protein FC695_26520 [Bacillus cereus]|uniref:Uncharacterized protein n=1 Tax=Bacillus cereus TaxID=1396 RepID=A0A9X9A5S2_BACCE|nr:hypothetical protein FC695_26520 [Bacillus cereus]
MTTIIPKPSKSKKSSSKESRLYMDEFDQQEAVIVTSKIIKLEPGRGRIVVDVCNEMHNIQFMDILKVETPSN